MSPLMLLLPLLAAQSPVAKPITFAAEVEMVKLSVTVLDKKGRYVTGLTKENFTILESGVPQTVTFWETQKMPLRATLLIDTSGSMGGRLKDIRKAAAKFIEKLRPQDQAQVIQFNTRNTTVCEFTPGDKAGQKILKDSLGQLQASGSTALYNALYVIAGELPKTPDARQVLIVFSDGEDTASLVEDDQVFEKIKRTSIAVYSINLRSEFENAPERRSIKADTFFSFLTKDTGGLAFTITNIAELGRIYEQIANELAVQYQMGYVPSDTRHDGAWRTIGVSTGASDRTLRHKNGYYAPGKPKK